MKTKFYSIILTAIISLLILSIPSTGICQEAKEEGNNEEVRGYLMIGGAGLDIDDLNDYLTTKNYPAFSDEFFSIGGGFLRQKCNGWLVGFEGHLMVAESNKFSLNNQNYSASLIGACGFFDIGYAVVSTGSFNMYPLVGLGFGGTWMDVGKSNFDDILDEPVGNAEISNGSFLLNLAVGSDYMIKFKDSKDIEGLVLGFRAGYTYSPWKSGWWTDMYEIDGGPKMGMTGPYFRFMIGFGGKGDWWKDDK